jgi:CRISPR-associated protein Cas1
VKKLLETIYILTPESYVHHRNENICITIGGQEKASIPIQQVHSIIFFGKNTLSTSLLGFCAKHDITITFFRDIAVNAL